MWLQVFMPAISTLCVALALYITTVVNKSKADHEAVVALAKKNADEIASLTATVTRLVGGKTQTDQTHFEALEKLRADHLAAIKALDDKLQTANLMLAELKGANAVLALVGAREKELTRLTELMATLPVVPSEPANE